MRLLEYQGKNLFKRYGIPVGKGTFSTDVDDVLRSADLYGFPVVLKTQVYSGGRGKLGGIAVCASPEELRKKASNILELTINGESSRGLLVEEVLDIEKEFYLGITIDPSLGAPVMIFSCQGGVNIEDVAKKEPGAVGRLCLPLLSPCRKHSLTSFFKESGAPSEILKGLTEIAFSLSRLFFEEDATTAEINPLAVVKSGELIAADSKVVIDDAALYRRPETPLETVLLSPLEERAEKTNVSFVPLSGEIAVIAGGAGLAMATMDLVAHFGSTASSFLDTGGGISSESMAESLRISLAHPGVKGVVINVFGGINDCAVMAKGISEVIDNDKPQVPIVMKMRGHSQDEGWALLEARSVPIVKFGTTEDAVKMIIELVRPVR